LKSKQGTYLNIIFQELFLKFDQEQCEFELCGNRGKSNTHTSVPVFQASDNKWNKKYVELYNRRLHHLAEWTTRSENEKKQMKQ
jgi:hypothetical protein